MSEEFKSEEDVIGSLEGLAYFEKHPLSSDGFSFYSCMDYVSNEYVVGIFKDKKDNWHSLHHGLWINVHDKNDRTRKYDLNENEISEWISALQKGHIMDEDGHIYYCTKDGVIEDTGFKRSCSGYILDTEYLFKDSFVIDNKHEVIGDPNHDVYSSENITKNKLYKRQEDGSYKQIWESKDCIFQKWGFPDNIYFSGGSWRHPEMKDYFVDGQVDDATKQKIDIAIKLDKLRNTKDSLLEKQKKMEAEVTSQQRKMRYKNRIGNALGARDEYRKQIRDEFEDKTMELGKTGDSITGQKSTGQKEVAKIQTKIAKEFMLNRKKQNNQ